MSLSSTRIAEIRATPISAPVPEGPRVRIGVGAVRKKDAVIVRVRTEGGVIGYGESHHGLAPTAVAELVNTSLAEVLRGHDAMHSGVIWTALERHRRSHSLGTAVRLAASGIDMALWDIRGKVLDVGVGALLGAGPASFAAYKGGLTLGFQPPAQLAEEAQRYVHEQGYAALKLRIGDRPDDDVARMAAVRAAVGDAVTLFVDANCQYELRDYQRILPALQEIGAGWLEEPLHPERRRQLGELRGRTRIPIAAGENFHTAMEFADAVFTPLVDIVQPDVSKMGGITALKQVADMAATAGVGLAPHTSHTALNYAATLHVMAASPSSYVYEGTHSDNPFDDIFGGARFVVDGRASAPDGPGLGVTVDEDLLSRFPALPGPAYL